MAPIKYEEQMKDKLEKRSLQPSSESWATLANRLDAEEKNQNKSIFWWIGIAASIVGILFVTTMYFNNQPIEQKTQHIVDTHEDMNQEIEQIVKSQDIKVPNVTDELVLEDVGFENTNNTESVSKYDVKVIATEKNNAIKKVPNEKDALAQSQKNKLQNSVAFRDTEVMIEIRNATLSFENQKVQDVVAQIKILSANGSTVSDVEIDSLLKKAQNDILSNRIYNEKTRMVDASALLQDVEDDLQQSFRSKVFEALQSGYESVKTAVAERNN